MFLSDNNFGLFFNDTLTNCPDEIPVNWWVSFVPTSTMETVINNGRKGGKENPLAACDGFCHDISRTVLDEFRNYKEDPPYSSYEMILWLG